MQFKMWLARQKNLYDEAWWLRKAFFLTTEDVDLDKHLLSMSHLTTSKYCHQAWAQYGKCFSK